MSVSREHISAACRFHTQTESVGHVLHARLNRLETNPELHGLVEFALQAAAGSTYLIFRVDCELLAILGNWAYTINYL